MQTIFPLSSASEAAKYYEKDNYYAKDDLKDINATHWWGLGAEKLKLTGYVDPKRFIELLEGKIDQHTQLGRERHDDGVKHRPGYDLTFSAPKSVSIMAEISGDKSIYDMHDKAVNSALSYIQKHAALTRKTDNNLTEIEKTDNLIVAKFRHDTSRSVTTKNGESIIDCNLHTHAIVMNAVQRADGKWRSISGKRIYDLMKVGGLIYRTTLAEELMKKGGYEIEKTREDGLFEIKGFTREQIEAFSNRTLNINELKEKYGLKGYIDGKAATLMSRESKFKVDHSALHSEWKKRAKEENLPLDTISAHAKDKKEKVFLNFEGKSYSMQSVQYAMEHITERSSVFEEQDLLKSALAFGLGKVSVAMVIDAIETNKKDGLLVKVGNEQLTTFEMIKMEKNAIHMMQSCRNTLQGVSTNKTIKLYLDEINALAQNVGEYSLTTDQEKSIEMLLTNEDRFVAIQGYAGTGKTTMLDHVVKFAKTKGLTVTATATTGKAARGLAEEIGSESKTLSHLISNISALSKSEGQADIWIVDEAFMGGTQQIHEVMQLAIKYNKRVFFTGDRYQLHSPSAGDPIGLMMDAGMKTTSMTSVMRQKDHNYRIAVKKTIAGDIDSAFKKIGHNINEFSSKEERIQNIVKQYLSLSQSERNKTIIAVLTHADRDAINTQIRKTLIETGACNENTPTLTNHNFSAPQKRHIYNYETGDIIRFNKNYRSSGIKRGDYWKVMSVDKEKEIMELKKGSKTIEWKPGKIGISQQTAVDVFKEEIKQIQAGDHIRFTQAIRSLGVVNADTAIVNNILKNKAQITLENGNKVMLNLKKSGHHHWDYAWSSTMYAAQGQTTDRVIGLLESTNRNLNTYRSFYVLLSRAKYEAHITVDNINKVVKTIQENSGENENALTYLTKYEVQKKFTSALNNAYQKLDKHLHEFDEKMIRLERIAAEYCTLSNAAKAKAVVLVPNYKDRKVVNSLIRAKLKSLGKLSKHGVEIECLERQFVRNFEHAENYKIGDIIRFNQSNQKLGINSGDYVEIKETKSPNNRLTVEHNKQTLKLDLSSLITKKNTDIEVFQKTQYELSIGDKIRWTATRRSLGMTKDIEASVINISNSEVTVKLKSGKLLVFNSSQLGKQHFEYAYAYRLNSTLPKKFNHVISHLDEQTKNPRDQAKLFSIIGEAQKNVELYTHSKTFAISKLNLHTGKNISIHTVQDQLGMRDEVLKSLSKYQQSHRNIGQAWVSFFKEKEAGIDVTNLLKGIKGIEKSHNELANQIINSQELTRADIHAFGINFDKLNARADKHKANSLTQEYLICKSPLKRGAIASQILVNFDKFQGLLIDNKVNIAEMRDIAWQHQAKLEYCKLKPESKKLFKIVNTYMDYSKQCREKWQKIANIKNNGLVPDKNSMQFAYHISNLRNQTAYFIYKNLERFSPFTGKLSPKTIELLEKHSGQHAQFIERKTRQKNSDKTKDWNSFVKFERELNQIQLDKQEPLDFISQKNEEKFDRPFWDKDIVLDAIIKNPEQIISTIIGNEKNQKLSKGNQLVWGKKGSIKFKTTGARAGIISDFERGIHGNVIHYYSQTTGKDFYNSVTDLACIAGLSPEKSIIKKIEKTAKQLEKEEHVRQNDLRINKRKQIKAAKMWDSSIPIKNTLGERYLREHRGIDGNLSKLQFRFHPKAIDYVFNEKGEFEKRAFRPALLVAVKNEQGIVVSVQSIYLDPKTGDKDKSLDFTKRTHASPENRAALVYSGGGNELIFAEGPETAASLIQAKPNANIYISLGHIGSISHYSYLAKKHETRNILIAADNDDFSSTKEAPSWISLKKAAIDLANSGISVKIAKPESPNPRDFYNFTGNKIDFNDYLKELGPKAVEQNLRPNFEARIQDDSNINSFEIIPISRSQNTMNTEKTFNEVEQYNQEKPKDLSTNIHSFDKKVKDTEIDI